MQFDSLVVPGSKIRVFAGYLSVQGKGRYEAANDGDGYEDVSIDKDGHGILRANVASPSDVTLVFQAAAPDPTSTTYYEFSVFQCKYSGGAVTIVNRSPGEKEVHRTV